MHQNQKDSRGGGVVVASIGILKQHSNIAKIERGRQVDGPREEEDRLNRHTPDDATYDAFRTPIHLPDPCI